MFKNKLVNIMLIILVSLTLVGVVAFVLVNHYLQEPDPNAEPTIDEIIAQSFETKEITTNLLSNDYVRASFRIHVDSKSALSEVQKRDFQVNNIILRSLSGKRASDLAGPEGIEGFEKDIRDQINKLMQEGEVIQVYTTTWVVQ
ncbi:flagellar basal body-associated protein FliL [Alkalihalobacillus sp. MEB130]|uniref:flagellar basal body-associated protein FliL n=1 Tax=Alkalihalobacillus sp. MEB130 TaxID=2976704 RepID=UPI0028E03BAE|nr:flagellar basal body-associated protein FliL [Alkalihalobacillus sp. MEB130]MDT8859018.1 flagellar basal body-associated protein FliL [Alkalihalobacillus sp. MEB130]